MRYGILKQVLLAAGLVAIAGAANAPDKGGVGQTQAAFRSDADIAGQVWNALATDPQYTIWDAVGFHVFNGQVYLDGAVTQRYKKDGMERVVRMVPGVTGVSDSIRILPASGLDDRLRVQLAWAIYGVPAFRLNGIPGGFAPVHIVVENLHVTLSGVVTTDIDKAMALLRASTTGVSFGRVIDNLQVEHRAKKL
jgi:osmotically-inducible protein OsmY